MKEKMNLDNLFKIEASSFERQQADQERISTELEARKAEENKRAMEDRRQELLLRIEEAQENLSNMLSCNKVKCNMFEHYMQSLFKKTHSFQDSFGVCGFEVPKQKWRKGRTRSLQEIMGQKVSVQAQTLVGTLSDYHIDVCILELYAEKIAEETPRGTFSMEEPIGGTGRSHSYQILALASMAPNGFTSPTPEQISKVKLVHLVKTTKGILEVDYSKVQSVSLDQGFIETLRELVKPDTTLRFLFKKFGTEIKEPRY